MKTPRTVVGHIIKQLWIQFSVIILLALIGAAFSLVTPFALGAITNRLVGGISDTEVFKSVIGPAVAILFSGVAVTLVDNVGDYYSSVFSERLRGILSSEYFEKLLKLPQSYHDSQITGKIISRLDRSISSITLFVKVFSSTMMPVLFQTLAILALTAYFYWPIAVLILAMYPGYYFLTKVHSPKWQQLEKIKNEVIDLTNGRFAEVVTHIKMVRAYRMEDEELSRFRKGYQKIVAITRPQSLRWYSMEGIRGVTLNVVFCCILVTVVFLTANGRLNLGEMVMLIQVVMMAKQPILMMSWLVNAVQQASAGSRDYFAVMSEPESCSPPQRREIETGHLAESSVTGVKSSPAIEFSNVSFSYDGQNEVLSGVNFSVQPGENIALIGESGSGKSTLVDLLLKFYPVSEGKILLYGRDISNMPEKSVRESVGVVFQDSVLLSGNVYENISYGSSGINKEKVIEAARDAHALEFIKQLPQGNMTEIGENGVRLSGGQKQRLALARAFVKDAAILILDEATSSLDPKTEAYVQKGIRRLSAGRTTLTIAHRLATISESDRIVVFKGGKIEEIGAPSDLAKSGGLYSELLSIASSTGENDIRKLEKRLR